MHNFWSGLLHPYRCLSYISTVKWKHLMELNILKDGKEATSKRLLNSRLWHNVNVLLIVVIVSFERIHVSLYYLKRTSTTFFLYICPQLQYFSYWILFGIKSGQKMLLFGYIILIYYSTKLHALYAPTTSSHMYVCWCIHLRVYTILSILSTYSRAY